MDIEEARRRLESSALYQSEVAVILNEFEDSEELQKFMGKYETQQQELSAARHELTSIEAAAAQRRSSHTRRYSANFGSFASEDV